MKRFLTSLFLMATLVAWGAPKYVGVFVGDGAGLTNLPSSGGITNLQNNVKLGNWGITNNTLTSPKMHVGEIGIGATNGSSIEFANAELGFYSEGTFLFTSTDVNGTLTMNVHQIVEKSSIFEDDVTITNVTQNATLYANILAGNGSGITNISSVSLTTPVKAGFFTNYTATTADAVLMCTGTNQIITLPLAPPVGTMFTTISASLYGTVIVTNANGTQTICGGLTQTVYMTNRLTVIFDGSNYW